DAFGSNYSPRDAWRDAPRDASPATLRPMTIPIDPVLLSLGPVAVRWFGLLALLGLCLAVWGTLREVDRQRLSHGRVLDALAWALPAGVIFARLVFVLGWWDYYFTHASELWQLNLSGLS